MIDGSFSSSSLLLDLVDLLLQPFGVGQILVFEDVKVLIEFVDQGNRGRDVELGDVLFRNVAEHLHDGPQTVAVSDDQHIFTRLYCGNDSVIPEGKHSIDGDLQTLCKTSDTSVLGRSSGLMSL